jgi:hypothetical protein
LKECFSLLQARIEHHSQSLFFLGINYIVAFALHFMNVAHNRFDIGMTYNLSNIMERLTISYDMSGIV